METYLTLLYVTIEQEVALKELFLSKGWLYAKPDLSVLTSNVGPPESFTSTGGIVKFTDDNGATEQRAKIVHPKVVENEDGIVEDTCVKVEYDDEYGGDTDEVLTGQDYDDDDYNADDHDDDDDFADLVEAAEPVNEAPKETRKSPRNRSKKTKAKSVLTNQKTAQVISFQADGSLAQTVKETPKSKKRKVDGAEVGEGEAVDREDMMEVSLEDVLQDETIVQELNDTDEFNDNAFTGGLPQSYDDDIVQELNDLQETDDDTIDIGRAQQNDDGTFSCTVCWNVYSRLENARRHLKTHNLNLYQFLCRQCQRTFSEEAAYIRHCAFRHKSRSLICNDCGSAHGRKSEMKNHLKLRHGKTGKAAEKGFRYMCTFLDCNDEEVFSESSDLDDHINSEHQDHPVESLKSFIGDKYLKGIMSLLPRNVPKPVPKEDNETEENMIDKKMSYLKVCHVCGKTCTSDSTWRRHKKSHNSLYKYKCNTCGIYFMTEKMFKVHKKYRHELNSFLCTYCGIKMHRKHSIDMHILNVHADKVDLTKSHLKIYTCELDDCWRTFTHRTVYEDHLNTHTGDKPHKCQGCDKTFGNRVHRRGHEKVCLGVGVFNCDICKRAFPYKSALITHKKKIHKQFT